MTLHRPRDPSRSYAYGPVRLYLDELQGIEDVMLEAAGDLRIRADDATADRVVDLRELDRLDRLEMTSTALQLRLIVDRQTAELWSGGETRDGRGAAAEIDGILRHTRRNLRRVITSPRVFLVAAALGLAPQAGGWLGFYDIEDLRGPGLVAVAFAILVAVPIFLTYFVLQILPSRTVVTKTRREAPNFWRRKRDDIIISATSLSLGVLIGALLART